MMFLQQLLSEHGVRKMNTVVFKWTPRSLSEPVIHLGLQFGLKLELSAGFGKTTVKCSQVTTGYCNGHQCDHTAKRTKV